MENILAYSYTIQSGNGINTAFSFSFNYIDPAHISVKVGNVPRAFTWLTAGSISISPAPTGLVEIRRKTPKDNPPVNFSDGSVLAEADLDLLATFTLYCAQEADDVAAGGLLGFQGSYYGASSVAPTVDPLGNPRTTGDLYLDTSDPASAIMRVWDGLVWRAVTSVGSMKRTFIIAGVGQTVIPVPTYVVGSNVLLMFVNGSKLPLTDYVETSQNSITLNAALVGGEELEVFVFDSPISGSIAASGVDYTLPDGSHSTIDNLAGPTGAAMVGLGAGTVDSAVAAINATLPNKMLSVADITALRSVLKTSASAVFVRGVAASETGGGSFSLDLSDTSSVDDGRNTIVATDGGRWKWVAAPAPMNLQLSATANLTRLPGQLAQNVETFCVDGDTIYALAKGSYSLSDNSFIQPFKLLGGGIDASAPAIDLGVGADARAMVCTKGVLYVFTSGGQLKYINTRNYTGIITGAVTRPNGGFVQSAMMYGEFIIAPVWGTAAIEVWSTMNGRPILLDNFSTLTNLNASIVDGKDGFLYCINHSGTVNQLSRFQVTALGKISGYTTFTIPAMANHRYGVVSKGFLYTGNYAGTGTLEIDITKSTPVVTRTFTNSPAVALIDDKYLVGYVGTGTSVIDIDTGVSTVLHPTTRLLYPRMIGEFLVGYHEGTEAMPPGSTGNDSPMGQKLVLYKTKLGAKWPSTPAQIPRPLIRNTGTFVPTVAGTATAGAGTYTSQIGRYSMVGDLCYFNIVLSWTAHSGTGNISVLGLPFLSYVAPGVSAPVSVLTDSITYTAGGTVSASINSSSSSISMLVQTPGGALALLPMDTAGTLYISGVYEVAENNL